MRDAERFAGGLWLAPNGYSRRRIMMRLLVLLLIVCLVGCGTTPPAAITSVTKGKTSVAFESADVREYEIWGPVSGKVVKRIRALCIRLNVKGDVDMARTKIADEHGNQFLQLDSAAEFTGLPFSPDNLGKGKLLVITVPADNGSLVLRVGQEKIAR